MWAKVASYSFAIRTIMPVVVEVAARCRRRGVGDERDRASRRCEVEDLMPMASKPLPLLPVRLGICATLSRTRWVSPGCLCFEIFAGSPSEIAHC